jgi:hypothetical protein
VVPPQIPLGSGVTLGTRRNEHEKGGKEMRRLKTSRRFAGVIAVLVLATGITAASAQTHDRSLELTYTKWFAPGFPNMVGEVGGDIVGPFGGAVLNNPMPDATGRVQLSAIYIVRAADASRSLTMRVDGAYDTQTNTALLKGRVVDGSLKDARARAEFKVIECDQSPNGECFQGTISIK